jgi:Kef-type K+ transport system membrane component KefB
MDAHAHEMDSSELNSSAVSATLHCMTGCALGDFTGMAIATILGWGNVAQIALAIGLAYAFGFTLTARPLIAAGLGRRDVVSTALASDTISISIMEAVDNLVVLAIPAALSAGLGDPLFYISIAVGFAVAFPFAFAGNRYLIARGRGHALVHEYHH